MKPSYDQIVAEYMVAAAELDAVRHEYNTKPAPCPVSQEIAQRANDRNRKETETVKDSIHAETLKGWAAYCGLDAITWLRQADKPKNSEAHAEITAWAVDSATRATHYAHAYLKGNRK